MKNAGNLRARFENMAKQQEEEAKKKAEEERKKREEKDKKDKEEAKRKEEKRKQVIESVCFEFSADSALALCALYQLAFKKYLRMRMNFSTLQSKGSEVQIPYKTKVFFY